MPSAIRSAHCRPILEKSLKPCPSLCQLSLFTKIELLFEIHPLGSPCNGVMVRGAIRSYALRRPLTIRRSFPEKSFALLEDVWVSGGEGVFDEVDA